MVSYSNEIVAGVSGQKRVDVQELIDVLNTISAATKFSPDYNPEVSISSDVSPGLS